MPVVIDTAGFQIVPDIQGDDKEDTALLRQMVSQAESYIRSFKWSPPIERIYLASGIGGIFALFLVRFARPVAGAEDQELWVVVGDLPSAYFVIDEAPDPKEALEAYCELMEEWAEGVRAGDVSECFPVEAAPTEEHARMLLSRVEYIREKIIPDM